MKSSRRKFIKKTSQFTLATGFSMWFMSCDLYQPSHTNPEESFLTIAQVFSDNMVLQRDQPIPIWGWTNPGVMVELFFHGEIHRTIATEDEGKWFINLTPISQSGPLELKIKQGAHEIKIKNILVGDVYLCSGQSNMEWPMSRVENVQEEIRNSEDDKIRQFKVIPSVSFQPKKNLIGKWEICSPKTAANFSAVAYFFSKDLRYKYDVPIGLVNSTRGDSNIKMWIPIEGIEALNRDELLKDLMAKRMGRLEKKYQFLSVENNTKSKSEAWNKPEYNDEKWNTIQLPLAWGESDFREMLGKIWFRKTIFLKRLPSEHSTIIINLAQIDDTDITFLNGHKIGEGKQVYDKVREYKVDPFVLKRGKNVLAISIENYKEFGGIFGNSHDLFIEMEGKKKSIAGEWKMKIESLNYNQEWLFEKGLIPSVLHNTMISPLQKFPFKAILWYQGETDTMNDKAKIFEYRYLFEKLISSWRNQFGNNTLPFIFAQLSNAMNSCTKPSDSLWASLRESQSQALQIKNTAQVINIDSGKHENTVHPQNKEELGRRFSLAVQKLVFEEKVIANGPTFKSMKIQGNYIYIYFSNIAKSLLLKSGNEVKELAIAGSDKKFFWAKSRVEVDRIIVWNDEVSAPVAVRYAWCDNPLNVNLYNSEGLPAEPFRSDNW